MLFANIDYLTPDFEIAHGFIGTEGSRIIYVGACDPVGTPAFLTTDFGERYDGSGKLLLPGLYNTHTHAPMTLLRGYGENLVLQDWLYKRIFPFEAKITDGYAQPATLLAIAEMLRFGTVSFTDMYYNNGARIAAIQTSGIKCNLCGGVMVFDQEKRLEDMPDYEMNKALVRDYHGAFDGRLRIDLNIHSEYISNPYVVRSIGELALDMGVNTHTHISETKLEHEECKQRRGGLTPVAYFDSLDFFVAPCTAAHCVWTEAGDWEIMAARGVTAVANPASNMKLASGFAPVPEMLAAGVNIGLGTDGMASNNNHNLLKELYLLGLISKGATGDPTVVTPAQALATATVNGARSQGRADGGRIAEGCAADVAVLDVNTPWMTPVHDQLSNLIFAAQGSDVVLTMVDGVVLYRDGSWPTIDVEKALAETQAAADTIVASL
ncbi:MAG: amidohydrolase [Coriobacteriales bacterium]|jgi:5-methylthioadenosine/S-adenosylhomocysteine deaminase|nr:amidohydrolase [Coriobacteriales bacterium]